MTTRDIRELEDILAEDEELDLATDDDSQGLYEPEQLAESGWPESVEGVLQIYFSQAAQTPLLSAAEEKQLGSQIEEGKYLSRLEQDWVAKYGTQPSATDLLLRLGHNLGKLDRLFEALCSHLGLEAELPLQERVLHPKLRQAIDSQIDSRLTTRLAEATGLSQTEVHQGLVELSVSSRLIPWHLLEGLITERTLAGFEEALTSPQFSQWLESHRPEIARHLEQIRERAHQATEHMVRANLRLVIAVAKKYIGRGMSLLDLIQEGNLGLIRAVNKFDHRRGYKISTYTTWWIRQSISRAIADQ